MSESEEKIVVLITAPSKDEAEKLGTMLVEKSLAACVNIISGVTSIFVWEGKPCREEETLLLIKTRKSLFQPLCEAVLGCHSYSVPEIIALPILAGSPAYLKWIEDATQ